MKSEIEKEIESERMNESYFAITLNVFIFNDVQRTRVQHDA